MHPQQRTMLAIVMLGVVALLASYAYILGIDPATQAGLWGGVAAALLPAYVATMALATGGYFAFTFFLLFRAHLDRVRIAGRLGYPMFPMLYMMTLAPSAMGLPLASAMVRLRSWVDQWLEEGVAASGPRTLRPKMACCAAWLSLDTGARMTSCHSLAWPER